ncbi:MAG: HEPN domain-containing protein [Anaerolineales bacterium]|nr:HEPN domain-containing protein [Anaerolineales bacterium]MCB8937968.1 HEPN domain-containing protein [Ardenticatenaceae bacterium]
MDDLEKQIAFWRGSATEEWEVANELLALGRIRHALFWAHLALEKMLKAHVLHQTKQEPPKIHNLSRLLALTNLEVDQDKLKLLAEMNRYNIEGRYALMPVTLPEANQIQAYWSRIEGTLQWLRNQF